MSSFSPHECQSIIGHEEAKKQIIDSYKSKRMHHAWLLTGMVGIGKATIAYQTANMFLSNGDSLVGNINIESKTYKLISAQSHPDLLVVSRPYDEKTGIQKNIIPVDEARKIAPFLSLTSSQSQGRAVIIDEAHTLNRNGQNAILKMIEEPPTGSIVILTATSTAMLLPTILSRCCVVSLNPLKDNEISTILARQSIDISDDINKDLFYKLSSGSVGNAIKILESDAMTLFDDLMIILKSLPKMDISLIHNFADQISKKSDSDKFDVISKMIIDILQDTIHLQAKGYPDYYGLSDNFAPNGRVDIALDIYEAVNKSISDGKNANLDKKLIFINAISEMSRIMA